MKSLIVLAEVGGWQGDFLWALLRVVILVGFILLIVPGLIWWERRLLAWFQDRWGPNRVGPFGLLQPIADGIKLFLKEDVTPTAIDRAIYFLAPAVALFPAFVIGATIPWGPDKRLTPVADVDIGILWVLAVSSLGVYGIMLGGWASNNKYSLLGGLRSSAQLISYELAMGVSLYAVALPTGSLMMTEMVYRQFEPLWGVVPWLQNWFILTPYGFVAGIIFLITMVAETNRAPFDLPEAESELIAGYHTEYSSMKFVVFFMGEYAVMLAFSGVFATLFLGGWSPLPLNWEYLAERAGEMGWTGVAGLLQAVVHPAIAPLWFLGKVFLGITFYIWLRATYPRLRYDQLMALGWKFLLPAAAANFVITAITMLYRWKVALVCWLVVGLGYGMIYWGYLRKRSAQYARGIRLVDLQVSEEPSHLSEERV